MLAHLEIWKINLLQVGEIDICRHHLAALADSLGEPDGYGPSARPDVKAPPTGLGQLTPAVRNRVEDTFQESQAIILGLLAPSRGESVTRPEIRRLSGSGCMLGF